MPTESGRNGISRPCQLLSRMDFRIGWNIKTGTVNARTAVEGTASACVQKCKENWVLTNGHIRSKIIEPISILI